MHPYIKSFYSVNNVTVTKCSFFDKSNFSLVILCYRCDNIFFVGMLPLPLQCNDINMSILAVLRFETGRGAAECRARIS